MIAAETDDDRKAFEYVSEKRKKVASGIVDEIFPAGSDDKKTRAIVKIALALDDAYRDGQTDPHGIGS